MPQLHGQYEGDRSRKDMLVEHGFRLPSARDNRPLQFDEVLERHQPGACSCRRRRRAYELRVSDQVVEQIVRPTGLVDPEVIVKPTKGQIDDLIENINERVDQGRPGAGHDADQEDGRGPHRVPARAGPAGALPALQHRHDPAHRDPARRCASASSTCSSASTCCVRASTCPRCRWSRILDADKEGFLRSETSLDPDDRPRRPQRRRPGDHVRRQDHRLDDAGRSTMTQQPAGVADRLQRRARHQPADDPQGRRRHPVDAAARRRRRAGARARTGAASASGTRSSAS